VNSPASARAAEDDLRDSIQAHQDRLLRHALHATGRHPTTGARHDVAAAALATAAAARSLAEIATADTSRSLRLDSARRHKAARMAARTMWLLLLLGALGAVFADRGYVAACAAAFTTVLAWQTFLLTTRAWGLAAIVVCGAALTVAIATGFIPGIVLAASGLVIARLRCNSGAAPDAREDVV